MSLARRRMARQTGQGPERTQMMTPNSPWSNWRLSTIVDDTMPPRDPSDDDDDEEEEEDEENEERHNEPAVIREPEPDE
jgi:hypothetical protein